jgi:hypothetical protein
VHRNPQNNFWEQRGWRLTVCQAWLSSCNAELRTFPTTKSIINYCIVGHKLLDGALVISINCLGTCGVTVRQSTLRLPSAQGYPIICFSPPPQSLLRHITTTPTSSSRWVSIRRISNYPAPAPASGDAPEKKSETSTAMSTSSSSSSPSLHYIPSDSPTPPISPLTLPSTEITYPYPRLDPIIEHVKADHKQDAVTVTTRQRVSSVSSISFKSNGVSISAGQAKAKRSPRIRGCSPPPPS